jgi:hypothetical protein
MGGFTTGGLNFDARVRRESFEPVEFYAHTGGMDAFARDLKIAAEIRADGRLAELVKNRYAWVDLRTQNARSRNCNFDQKAPESQPYHRDAAVHELKKDHLCGKPTQDGIYRQKASASGGCGFRLFFANSCGSLASFNPRACEILRRSPQVASWFQQRVFSDPRLDETAL